MKVWITRPDSIRYHWSGLRHVRVWIEQPVFDQRAIIKQFDLYNEDTKLWGPEIYGEAGWVSRTGSLKAKPFLKQDRRIKGLVLDKIYESLIPSSWPDPINAEMSEQEYDRLLEPMYELECMTHWKRFLLELDLKAETVTRIEPKVKWCEGEDAGAYPITQATGSSSLFTDGDLTKPYQPGDFPGFTINLSATL